MLGEREGTTAEAEKRGLRRRVGGGTTGRAPAVAGGNDGGVVVGVAGGTGSGTKCAPWRVLRGTT